ncbi:DUF1992 domain-containing protein [Kineococcus terrestris]|uniref:DnaJ family domain-containing protein n=1 Tax=Kineococcus terrestris TaxID=2044856 RepID=UPI0034DB1C6E
MREPVRRPSDDRVERQVREAQARGAFDDLPGAGRPLRGLDREFTVEGWAAEKVRREGFDLSAVLPPALALRREREQLLDEAGVAALRSEPEARAVGEDFNARVRELYRRPADGPLVVVPLVDVEDLVARWRAARPAPAAPVRQAPPVAAQRRRRWWRRRRE